MWRSLYRKSIWEFINIDKKSKLLEPLSNVLSLPIKYILRNKGVWLANINKSSNFESLNSSEKKNLDKQLNYMIESKYHSVNYNGYRTKHLNDFEDRMRKIW